MRKFLRFAVIGGIGFAVDTAVLLTLLALSPAGPIFARCISIAVALTATWLFNRTFTFGPSGRPVVNEGARYAAVGLTTSAVNFAVYSLVILVAPAVAPFLALVIGSAVALLLSFAGYDKLVFNRA